MMGNKSKHVVWTTLEDKECANNTEDDNSLEWKTMTAVLAML